MTNVNSESFNKEYGEIFKGWILWNDLKSPKENVYQWEEILYLRK